jgi:DNA-binding beta-propeller fold protein YncE
MNRTSQYLSLAVVFAALVAGASGYRLLERVALPGTGTWDYVMVDATARRVYVSHETQVQVLDADTQQIVGSIPDTPGAHGIAIAPEFERGFISAGLANSVIVFDLKTLKPVGKIKTGQKPDSILYDPASKRVFAMNGDSNSATVIHSGDSRVESTIDLGGGPEFSVSDGQGNIYVNLKNQNQLARIDSRSLTVKDHWPLAPCAAPASLALDQKNRRLFVGCRSKVMAVVDADNGRVIATYPIGDHVDASVFDPATGLVLNSTGEGTVAVFHQDSADKYSLLETIQTNPGSKTMGLDPKTHQLFIPANLSGAFTVLVYGR